jgi:hypothetical protein
MKEMVVYTHISKISDVHSVCADQFQQMRNDWLPFSEHIKKAEKSMVNKMALRMK